MNDYYGIKNYIPEICPTAVRHDNHFECDNRCKWINSKDSYICPCFGKNGLGWIPVSKEKEQELIDEVKRWNKCREKIPNKDAYYLKRIKYFRIGKFDLMIEQFEQGDLDKVKKEMLRLFRNGDKITFNEDYGVGQIIDNKDGTYTVEKWYYGSKSSPVKSGSLDDVFTFLWDFWGEPEPFSYTKAGYPELERRY